VREYGIGHKLIGKDYVTADLYAKVTGQAKYAEDYRAEGMLSASCCSARCRTHA
jgi:CO/xanthine dehydrogenase Mo-binding subunit